MPVVMGAGFVIILWLIALGIVGTIWIGLVVLCIVGWKKKKPWLKWLAGIPAALMLAFGLLLGGLFAYGTYEALNPNSVFKNTFGDRPSQKISDLHSSLWWFADTGSVYLRFKTTEEEFRHLAPKRLAALPMEEIKRQTPSEYGSEPPSWWSYQFNPQWIYLFRDTSKPGSTSTQGFHTEMEYFAYDPDNHIAYYRYLGFD